MRLILTLSIILLVAMPAAGQGFTMRVSGDIVIPRDTVQDGSAFTMNGRIQVDGTLRGDAMTLNGDIAVNGTVTGSVRTMNGSVVLAPSAVVGEDVWAVNGRIDRQPGAQVRGRISQGRIFGPSPPSTPPPPFTPPGPRPWRWQWYGWWPSVMRAMATWTMISFIILAAVVAAVFPVTVKRIADTLHQAPGEALIAGILLWSALPLLAVVLALSVVGIPVLIFLPFGVMLIGLAGFAGASQLIGDRLLGGFEQQHATALEALVGAVVLGVLVFIPGLGWLALALALTWGIGAVLLLIFRRGRGSAARTVA